MIVLRARNKDSQLVLIFIRLCGIKKMSCTFGCGMQDTGYEG